MIFIDTNIVVDLIEGVSAFSSWSRGALARHGLRSPRVTDKVVFAECAGHFASADDQLAFFAEYRVALIDLSAEAARRAGLAHRAYRRAGGRREAILADFLIGGHAAALGATLLTRDRQRFASYFPDLTLITPETHPHG